MSISSSLISTKAKTKKELPKRPLPFSPSELLPVQQFVTTALSSTANNTSKKSFAALLDAVRLNGDMEMVTKLFIALRTASASSTSTQWDIANKNQHHLRLLRILIRWNGYSIALQKYHQTVKQNQAAESSKTAQLSFHWNAIYAHAQWLLATASAHPALFLVPILTSLQQCFLRIYDCEQAMVAEDSEEATGDSEKQQTKDSSIAQALSWTHAIVYTLFSWLPASRPEWQQLVLQHLSSNSMTMTSRSWYIQNVALEYGLSNILPTLLQLGLTLDVQIKVEESGNAIVDVSSDNENEEALPLMEDEENQQEKATKTTPAPQVDQVADELDTLLLIILNHMNRQCVSTIQEDDDNQSDKSQNMLSLVQSYYDACMSTFFESYLLRTHRSKCVQFVLFYLCGWDASLRKEHCTEQTNRPPLAVQFTNKLLSLIRQETAATTTATAFASSSLPLRQSAACYAASFASRATFVEKDLVETIVDALLTFVENYNYTTTATTRRSSTTVVSSGDVQQQHALFYTVSQAALYIVCFRGPDLRNSTRVSADRWLQLFHHPLESLHHCLESVRSEFLVVAKAYEWLGNTTTVSATECESQQQQQAEPSPLQEQQAAMTPPPKPSSLLTGERSIVVSTSKKKRKRRSVLISTPAAAISMQQRRRITGGVGGLGHGTNPLDSFFPFDPYLLSRSNVYIEPYYHHWNGSVVEKGESEEGTVSVHDEEEAEEQQFVVDTEQVELSDSGGEEENNAVDSNATVQSDEDEVSVMSLNSTGSFQRRQRQQEQTEEEEVLQDAWTKTVLKRARAPSIETGSW